ncbi:ribosome-binding factor A [Thermus filiformis]|uniref:Ribosome-binding factor A n=1 Tax=Thermus filiformis TaxID=276 RepID=A0A0D6XB21_THEFI|nr:ribosome-binding factor A [Thermus filiformis]KIX84516.1 ribosome-binding factor A [Thermus filiformis]
MAHAREHLEHRLLLALREEVKALEDPRLFMVSLLRGELSPDGRVYTVYIDALFSPEEALRALEGASERILGGLARRVRLKHLPRLEWRYAGAD